MCWTAVTLHVISTTFMKTLHRQKIRDTQTLYMKAANVWWTQAAVITSAFYVPGCIDPHASFLFYSLKNFSAEEEEADFIPPPSLTALDNLMHWQLIQAVFRIRPLMWCRKPDKKRSANQPSSWNDAHTFYDSYVKSTTLANAFLALLRVTVCSSRV